MTATGLKRAALRLWSIVLRVRQRSPIRRFVIVSLGRSGTELLVDLLDAHPHIRCESEVLASSTRFPVSFLEGRAAAAASRGAHAYGVKVLRHHFARYPAEGRPVLAKLVSHGFVVVVVRRRNLLRQALSHHRAHSSGTFHVRDEADPAQADIAFSPEPEELVNWLRGVERDGADLDRIVAGLPAIELWYEDDLSTPEQQQATVDRICDVLGLDTASVTASVRKARRQNLSDSFVNASEIRAHLETTRFGHLWDDD